MEKIPGIYGFHTINYQWLSNFWQVSINAFGLIFPSVEHAYQASKTDIKELQQMIAKFSYAESAKKFGKNIQLIPNWNMRKIEFMKEYLTQKFNQEHFKKKLLNTGTLYLEETNNWKDTFWGVCNGIGQNILGKLIMDIRTELQKQSAP
jgi:ribA/ribD-fused uncharacterized protein